MRDGVVRVLVQAARFAAEASSLKPGPDEPIKSVYGFAKHSSAALATLTTFDGSLLQMLQAGGVATMVTLMLAVNDRQQQLMVDNYGDVVQQQQQQQQQGSDGEPVWVTASEALESGAAGLHNLSINGQSRTRMLEAGAIKLIVKIFQGVIQTMDATGSSGHGNGEQLVKSEAMVLAEAASAVMCLAVDAASRRELVDAGVVEPLVRLCAFKGASGMEEIQQRIGRAASTALCTLASSASQACGHKPSDSADRIELKMYEDGQQILDALLQETVFAHFAELCTAAAAAAAGAATTTTNVQMDTEVFLNIARTLAYLCGADKEEVERGVLNQKEQGTVSAGRRSLIIRVINMPASAMLVAPLASCICHLLGTKPAESADAVAVGAVGAVGASGGGGGGGGGGAAAAAAAAAGAGVAVAAAGVECDPGLESDPGMEMDFSGFGDGDDSSAGFSGGDGGTGRSDTASGDSNAQAMMMASEETRGAVKAVAVCLLMFSLAQQNQNQDQAGGGQGSAEAGASGSSSASAAPPPSAPGQVDMKKGLLWKCIMVEKGVVPPLIQVGGRKDRS